MNGKNDLQIMYLIKGWYPQYTKGTHRTQQQSNSKQADFKNGQRSWVDAFPRNSNG